MLQLLEAETTCRVVTLEQLHPDPRNVRRSMGDIAHLAHLIETSGTVTTLMVTELPNDQYELIQGHRRRLACLLLRKQGKPIPILRAEVMPDAEHRRIHQLVENLGRKDLNWVEQAQAIEQIVSECGVPIRAACLYLGSDIRRGERVCRALRGLHADVAERIRVREDVTYTEALTVAGLSRAEQLEKLWPKQTTKRRARSKSKVAPVGQLQLERHLAAAQQAGCPREVLRTLQYLMGKVRIPPWAQRRR